MSEKYMSIISFLGFYSIWQIVSFLSILIGPPAGAWAIFGAHKETRNEARIARICLGLIVLFTSMVHLFILVQKSEMYPR